MRILIAVAKVYSRVLVGIFAGAHPLRYFAQEYVSLLAAMVLSGAIAIASIGVRSITLGAGVGVLRAQNARTEADVARAESEAKLTPAVF